MITCKKHYGDLRWLGGLIFYPLVMSNIAIENGHRNSGCSHEKWWFSIVFCMFTRGYLSFPKKNHRKVYHWCETNSFPFSRRTYKVKKNNKFPHLCMVTSWFITFWTDDCYDCYLSSHFSIISPSVYYSFSWQSLLSSRESIFFPCYQGGCQTLHVQGGECVAKGHSIFPSSINLFRKKTHWEQMFKTNI